MKIDVFQGGVIAHTLYGERLLSRPPSPALQDLMDIKPKLCNEVSGRLTCGNTPLNFNGTLAMGVCADDIAHLYEAQGAHPPEVVVRPYEILHDVPLSYYDGAKSSYQPTPHTAPAVLMKYACGMPVGLVTQGELCGVVAELMDNTAPHEGLAITNLWSDARLTKEVPYLPYMHVYNQDQRLCLLEDEAQAIAEREENY